MYYVFPTPAGPSKADEQPCQWAVQNGDDAQTRRPLPGWMASVLEIRVAQFVDDSQRWQEKIMKRDSAGKSLTRAQLEKYNQWKLGHNPKIIFDRTKRRCITDAKQVNKDCFAVQLHLSEEAAQLELSACTGSRFRLLLLRGPKVEVDEKVAMDFEGPIPQDAIDELQSGEDSEPEPDRPAEAENAILDFEKAQMDAGECDGLEHSDEVDEIIGDSDEELEDFGLKPQRTCKVKSFNSRPAWVELERLELTSLPRHITGCSIGFHVSSRQWHGFYPHVHSGLCWSFGGRTNRTEKEAILRTIRAILEAHIAANPKDAMWRVQLHKIKTTEATL